MPGRLDDVGFRVDAEANGIYLAPATLDVRAQLLRHGTSGEGVFLSRVEAVVLDRLMTPVGHFSSLEQLTTAAWPDPDLEPDSAWSQLRQAIVHLRKALRQVVGAELTIWCERGVGYALVPRRKYVAISN